MKITSIGINNIYNDNQKIRDTKKSPSTSSTSSQDVIQISSLGKSLSSFSVDGTYSLSDSELEMIKNQVSNGTYSRDSKLVAEKIFDVIKGRDL